MSRNFEAITKDTSWLSKVTEKNFESRALSLFAFQYEHNTLYRQFVTAIGRDPDQVRSLLQIPFLPIVFFKTHKIYIGEQVPELIFESSGTTGTVNSKHYIANAGLYRQSFLQTFRTFYGAPEDYVFLCLLPSYLERKNSSLVYMADALIGASHHPESGFYLHNFDALARQLTYCRQQNKKILLLGVTFALLDFAAAYPIDMEGVIVMETGGMKGRKEEWSRQQVHDFLKEKWHLTNIHSEYGMTELLSQAYAPKDGLFRNAATLRPIIRSETDPFDLSETGQGGLNIIDLANVYSCPFIATDDRGRIHPDGQFEVLGRLDHSALRGCSLMVV